MAQVISGTSEHRRGAGLRLRDWARLHVKPYHLPLVLGGVPLLLVLLLGVFVLYMSFIPKLPTTFEYTLEHWIGVFHPRMLTGVLPNTAIVGFGGMFLTLLFGAPIAYLLNRTTMPLRKSVFACIAVVALIPGFVTAMGWTILINERIGILNGALRDALGIDIPISMDNAWGIAWVIGLELTPLVVFLLSGPMRQLDPAMEEAAATSGVDRIRTFRYVALPLVWPAIMGAGIYVFMTAISIFEIPAVLGGFGGQAPVLATELFFAVGGDNVYTEPRYGAAGVFAVLIMAPSLVGLYFYFKLIDKSHRFSVVTGKGYRPREIDLGWWTWVGMAFVAFYILLAAVFPLLVLFWASIAPFQLPSLSALGNLTFRYYDPNDLLRAFGGWPVLRNTVILVASVGVIVPFISVMISWIVVRTRLPIRQAMDITAMLPHAIPGLAFAFALFVLGLLLDIKLGLPIMGSLLLIIIANIVNQLSYATRLTNAGLIQVHRELEEAGSTCGTTTFTNIWHILMPLIRPTLIFAAAYVSLRAFREVTMALFLASPENQVIAVKVFMMWTTAPLPQAASGALVLVLLILALVGLAFVLTGGRILRGRPQMRAEAVN